MRTLSVALFGVELPLMAFPYKPDVCGIGLSDWGGYAATLQLHLNYRNTFFHDEPFLDICSPPAELSEAHDFLLSSDVFEHVLPPLERALLGAHQLLKPGGVLVMTMPYRPGDHDVEHFPDLAEFEIIDFHGEPLLINRTSNGHWQVFDDIVFHGGPGATLEMRNISREGILNRLRHVGFSDVFEDSVERPDWGIIWLHTHSMPLVARREDRSAAEYGPKAL
jgi:SAM-dependent methyltransferase